MTSLAKTTELLDTTSAGIIKLVKETPRNTLFTMETNSDYPESFSIFGYLIFKGDMSTIEEICNACPDRIEDLFLSEDVVPRLMETNGQFSEYMLAILKDMVNKKAFQSYLLYSNYSEATINRFLIYCDFSTAFDKIVANDNGELLKKFLSSPEQYGDFSRIIRERSGANLWQKCIDCYAVECEAVIKEMIVISRAI